MLLDQAGIGHAALAWDSGGCTRLAYMAFPFETIDTAATREAVMGRILNFLAPCEVQPRQVYLPLVIKVH